jgi:hypothetical protein
MSTPERKTKSKNILDIIKDILALIFALSMGIFSVWEGIQIRLNPGMYKGYKINASYVSAETFSNFMLFGGGIFLLGAIGYIITYIYPLLKGGDDNNISPPE